MTDPNYWRGRWEKGETGWHQTEVEPRLIENFTSLQPTRVLVPLCGKSLDLAWIHEQGHEVVGIELSELACREFFKEQKLNPVVTREGSFQIFEAPGYKLFQGDFFDLTPQLLGNVGAVYDRAALIALPPEMRVRYASHLKLLLEASLRKSEFRFLQITLERNPSDLKGPPHSVTEDEIRRLYQDTFAIECVSAEPLPERSPSDSIIHEKVFCFSKKETQAPSEIAVKH